MCVCVCVCVCGAPIVAPPSVVMAKVLDWPPGTGFLPLSDKLFERDAWPWVALVAALTSGG